MRAHRLLVLALLAGFATLAGCVDLDAGDAERLFEQDEGPLETEDEPPAPAVDDGTNLTIHVVDVGQGDGIVVHLPDHTAVYDTGGWHDDSETAVRDHLQAEGADPDALVVSHPDADHAGGCALLLETFTFDAIYHPGIAKDTQTWRDCEQAMREEGAPVYTDADLAIGQQLAWSTHARIEILHVDADAEDANAGSLAMQIRYGEAALALTGDATCEAEQGIVDRGIVGDLDVVQVAHHGSATSTCEPWLDATDPEVGVISVGAGNTYGHPHDEVLDRLAAHGVDVYRTDTHGTVELTTDGTSWDVRTQTGADVLEHDAEPRNEATPTNTSPVQIAHVRYDAEGDDNGNLTDEWVEIANEGTDAVEIGGWTLADEANHTYTVPESFTLEANASVQVHTGSGQDDAEHLYWGRSQAVWNNDGDTATLRDAEGALVDEESY